MADTSGMTQLEQQHVLTDESMNALGPDPEQEIRPERTRVPQPEIEPAEPEPQLEQEQIHTQGPEPTQEPIDAQEEVLPQEPLDAQVIPHEPVDAQEEVLPQEPVPQPAGAEHAQEQAVQQAQLHLPLRDLFEDERRRDFFDICVPLYEASIKGEWDVALGILERTDQDQDYTYLVRCSITDHCETALHVAASAQNTSVVRNLVHKMQIEDLRYQNLAGNTALCLAAMTGNVEIATIMVGLDPNLLTISNKNGMIPLYIAALYGKRDMVNYLYDETNRQEWTDQNKTWVYVKCVEADLFDIALKIFRMHPDVFQNETQSVPGVNQNELTQSVLGVLARKPSAFNERRRHTMWRIVSSINCWWPRPIANNKSEALELLSAILTSIEKKPKKEIDRILRGPHLKPQDEPVTYPSRILFVAAEMGNTKFIVELIRKYPDLIWKQNDDGLSLFHVAVAHRHQDIYNLLYEIGSMRDLIVVLKDKDGNNMLHLVGKTFEKSRLQDVSGAAFQMQRELLWYKEVESMIPPSYRERKNKRGQTPHEVFTDSHEKLVSDGENWMRGTASKCMLVATLIATIVFGVAYTIPGGYDEKLGVPIFRHNVPFLVFVVLDAISLVLSSTSILVFLSILTSRYSQEDFIHSLPKKLMLGLSMLFLSIITMMIAFSVSFYVLYRHKFIIIAGFISLLALIPIIAYAKLQFPLLRDVYSSTYGSRYLFKPKKQMLYYRNPSV
ncbi:Ankyrin repeat-containing protein [Artemisia annua]|uniref:Ankyrin repeat-containing protein n=1 Tax=Artemisia annua TaxID=35608 RepID=A0A2U1KQU4_ARTAN|nr:Ankyrin repeat-containing protein [Artemisia annua]